MVRRLTTFERAILSGARAGRMREAWRAIADEVGECAGVRIVWMSFGMDQEWGDSSRVPRLALVVKDSAEREVLAGKLREAGEVALRLVRERMEAGRCKELLAEWERQIGGPRYVGLLIPTAYSVSGLQAADAAVKAEQERRDFAPRLAKKYAERLASMSEYAAGVFHVFFHTDAMEAEARKDGFMEALEEEVLANLLELGFEGMTREKVKLEWYSKEYVDREFGGRMQDFYR